MAAYAALNSVMYILQQIQNHPRPPITIEKQHMDSLCEIISSLQHFLEKQSHGDIGDDRKEALESRIAEAAYEAEDIIESSIVDQILPKSSLSQSHGDIGDINEALETQITDAAYAAEDVMETHTVDQILANSNLQEENNLSIGLVDQFFTEFFSHKTDPQIHRRKSKSLFCLDLRKVIEDMYVIKKEVIEIQEKIMGINDDQLPINIISMSENITGSSTLLPPRRNTNTMVGFDGVLIQITDRLTGHPPSRQVLPIVGMGGIGKTTLARNVYDHQYIVHHFHIRIWITISQEYMLRDILLEALSCHQNDENKSSEHELGQKLYKSLWGRRYLIILDDMWSIEAWKELMFFFPDNNNGSRVMITTRLSNVSNHFGSCGFKMNFLDEDKSWNLFCKIVFPQDQCCPPELEEIGKKIARNCKGLPLSIVVIGGLLAKSEKTQQHWGYIAENITPIVNLEDDNDCFKIFYLSYNHLPVHLKPCFLYMGVFPEDTKIAVSNLTRLWVAEGFLKPMEAKSLEEVAEEYLKDLIDRNLILVHKLGSSGKVKYCKIHDLLRDLCLRECEKNKFLWDSKFHDFDNLDKKQSQRRICEHIVASKKYQIDRIHNAMPSASLARSLIFDFKGVLAGSHIFNYKGANRLSKRFRLGRVFIMGSEYTYMDWEKRAKCSLRGIFELVNSRYLDFEPIWNSTSIFPSSIHLLWNLQTLIIKGSVWVIKVPPKIWEMSQLRHLEIDKWFSLPDPPNVSLIHVGDDEGFILRNLQTLKTVYNFKLSQEVIKIIPNIKKLKLSYDVIPNKHRLNNLGLLKKLESLHINGLFCNKLSFRIEFLKNLTFPHSLKKLALAETNFHWEDIRMIGSLPHLQVLKLKRDSFRGPEWNPVKGEFKCLKFLLIDDCNDLVYWNANSTHFPSLEQLLLRSLNKLTEIPLAIGQIPTLRSISLWYCSDYVVMSSKNLSDEQVELGNEDLQVSVFGNNPQLESLATNNFRVRSY